MLRYFFLLFALTLVLIFSMAGFRGQFSKKPPIEIFPDMDRQPKVKAQTPSQFFADGRSARQPVPQTIPIGYSIPIRDQQTGQIVQMSGPYKQIEFSSLPDYRHTGKFGDQWGTGFPIPVTIETLHRGQERYRIHCQVCHGPLGLGNGPAYELGLTTVANLHLDRIRNQADGEIFNTITHGKNTMLGYGSKITVDDRWAIIAYLRALQLAQNASPNDLPPHLLQQLQTPQPPEQPANPAAPNQTPAPPATAALSNSISTQSP